MQSAKVDFTDSHSEKWEEPFSIHLSLVLNNCCKIAKCCFCYLGKIAWYADHYNELMKEIPDGKLELNYKG